MTDVREAQAEVRATIGKLSLYQYKLLRRLTGSLNTYAAFSGEPGTQDENDANLLFNSVCQLVQMGLLLDISDDERFTRMHAEMEKQQQQIIIVTLSRRGRALFERKPWEKWVN